MQYLYRKRPALAKGRLERSTQIGGILQRRTAIAVSVVLLATCGFAQVLKRPHDDSQGPDKNQSKINAKSPKHYPRAIGVIEFLPGGGARLVPVALWIDDRFYDASLYGANPAPMAVEPGTVYEATDYGERLGLFTVGNPEEMKGSWVAAGKWKPRQALDEKLAQEAAKQPKPKPKPLDTDDERPTLKRPGASGSSGSSSGGASSGSASANSNGSGTASAGGGGAKSGTASSGTPSPAEEDPNRPTLKKPGESAPPSSTTAASTSAQATPSFDARRKRS